MNVQEAKTNVIPKGMLLQKLGTRTGRTVAYLGKQGLAFRGHRESLIDHSEENKGNFLGSLNYLSACDITTANHLEKVRNQQVMSKRRKGREKGAKGPSCKLTFLSNDTQNNLINIIDKEIA